MFNTGGSNLFDTVQRNANTTIHLRKLITNLIDWTKHANLIPHRAMHTQLPVDQCEQGNSH